MIEELNNYPVLSVDNTTGVLYIRRMGSISSICRHSSHDLDVIFSLDESGGIVGVTILGAADMNQGVWFGCPDRKSIPKDILDEVDNWFLQRNKTI